MIDIQLIVFVYICSEWKPNKEVHIALDYVKAQTWEMIQTISAASKTQMVEHVHFHSVPSFIIKWASLKPPAVFLDLLSQSDLLRMKNFFQKGKQEPSDYNLNSECLCGDEKTLQKHNHLCGIYQSGPVTRQPTPTPPPLRDNKIYQYQKKLIRICT